MGAASASSRRRATRCTLSTPSTSSTTSTKTSPPNRDTVSLAAAGPRHALRDSAEDEVADRVAQGVVHGLERVEPDEHHRGRAARPLRPEERAAQTVVEEHAVGEAGEGVVRRVLGELALEAAPPRHVLVRDERAVLAAGQARDGQVVAPRLAGDDGVVLEAVLALAPAEDSGESGERLAGGEGRRRRGAERGDEIAVGLAADPRAGGVRAVLGAGLPREVRGEEEADAVDDRDLGVEGVEHGLRERRPVGGGRQRRGVLVGQRGPPGCPAGPDGPVTHPWCSSRAAVARRAPPVHPRRRRTPVRADGGPRKLHIRRLPVLQDRRETTDAQIEAFVQPAWPASSISDSAAASCSSWRASEATISASASVRPTQEAPSTLLPGSRSL